MFRIIAKRLKTENIDHLEFITGMNRKKRKKTLELFRDNNGAYDVLLISMKCASVGLNLQCANHIIFVDPRCNPGLENQAIGRCWRLGQNKKVYVTRLITKGTVEEKILSLQQDEDEEEDGDNSNNKNKNLLKRKARLTEKDYDVIFGYKPEEDGEEQSNDDQENDNDENE